MRNSTFIVSFHASQLVLGHNQISDEGAKELAKALRTNNVLKKVFCAAAGSRMANNVFNATFHPPQLYLEFSQISDEGAKEFAKVLRANCTLELVCCSSCWSNEELNLHRIFPHFTAPPQ